MLKDFGSVDRPFPTGETVKYSNVLPGETLLLVTLSSIHAKVKYVLFQTLNRRQENNMVVHCS